MATDARVLEADIMHYFKRECERRGGVMRKVVYQGRNGAPDWQVFFPGNKLLIVELKAPGKKPHRDQEKELKMLKGLGFNALYVDSKAQIDELLKDIKCID